MPFDAARVPSVSVVGQSKHCFMISANHSVLNVACSSMATLCIFDCSTPKLCPNGNSIPLNYHKFGDLYYRFLHRRSVIDNQLTCETDGTHLAPFKTELQYNTLVLLSRK